MKILGISGDKGSGKNTAANFILGVNLVNYGVIRGSFKLNERGQIVISDIFGDDNINGVLNQDYYMNDETLNWWASNVWPLIKLYSFADPLKRLCIDILNLSHAQCYGTEDQKNTETQFEWQNMLGNFSQTGTMTAREVLQYIGTEVFRRIYNNVWVDTTIRQMQIEQPEMAIVTDVRFPNEVEGIQKNGGKVIRLTRSPYKKDSHNSEIALSKRYFNWENFDAIIDNHEMSITEQNQAIYNCLQPWDYIPELTIG